jgi:hypothetical protein
MNDRTLRSVSVRVSSVERERAAAATPSPIEHVDDDVVDVLSPVFQIEPVEQQQSVITDGNMSRTQDEIVGVDRTRPDVRRSPFVGRATSIVRV